MLDSLIKSPHNRSSNASKRKASLKSLGHINPDAKGAWDFPNKEMRIPTVRLGCAFLPRVRTAAVLAVMK